MVYQGLISRPGLYYVNGGPAISPSVSIINFNANLGINNTQSTLSVEVTLDRSCNVVPGRIPAPGECVYFQYNQFYFGGVVSKVDYSEDGGSGFKWTINIVDPRSILDNVKLLLKGYYCNQLDRDLINFYNLNFLLEGASAGGACNGDTDYPSVNPQGCYYFGLSGSGDSNGYKYGTSYFLGLQAIQNSGKPVYTSAGIPLYLNLYPVIQAASEIPYITADEDNTSLLKFITDCLDYAGYDFIVSINRGGMINFELVNRKSAPVYGLISQKIAEYQAKQTLLSFSEGLEDGNVTTQKVVIGDNVSYLKEVEMLDGKVAPDEDPTEEILVEMFCGYSIDGITPLRTRRLDMTSIPINVTDLIAADVLPSNFSPIWYINEAEILNSGSVGSWKSYALKNPNSLGRQILNHIVGLVVVENLSIEVIRLLALLTDPRGQHDALNKLATNLASLTKAINIAKYDDFSYNWFRGWIDEYYGKQWLVKFPNELICISPQIPWDKVTSGGVVKLSDVPTDAGFPYPGDFSLIGLPIYTRDIVPFLSDDGRAECFIRVPLNAQSKLEINRTLAFAQDNDGDGSPDDGNEDGVPDNIEYVDETVELPYKLEPSLLSGEYVYKNDGNIYIKANTVNGTMFRTYTDGQTELRVLIQTPFIPQIYDKNDIYVGLRALAGLIGDIPDAVVLPGSTNDGALFNQLFQKDQKKATPPTAACIPMKSNMYVYGPWYNSLAPNAIGSTEVISNPELNPWTYGGYGPLSIMGRMLADSGLRAQTRVETGNMQIAGPPDLNVGFYGSMVIKNITFNYGSNGVRTTYDFSTFTPKFGNYAEFVNQKVKETVKIIKELGKNILANENKKINAINSVRKAIDTKKAEIRTKFPSVPGSPGTSSSSTLQMLLFNSYPIQYGAAMEQQDQSNSDPGSYWISQPKKTCQEVVCYQQEQIPPSSGNSSNARAIYNSAGLDTSSSIQQFLNKNTYNNLSVVSLDAILSPVSTKGSGSLPRYATYSRNDLTRSNPVMPPVNINKKLVCNLPIVQTHLNPIMSVAGLNEWGDNRASGSNMGFFIIGISYGSDANKIFDKMERQQETNFRFSALKGPLVLQSWGYDTQGKPVPNAADNPIQCEAGNFSDYNLQDRFMKNWLSNPRTWPVGPIDLRWDRERGLWVAPPPEKLLVAQLLTDLNGLSMTDAVLLNPTSSGGDYFNPSETVFGYKVYGPEGEAISSNLGKTKIKVVDFLGRRLCQGTVVYVYHYGGGKYIVLESSAVNEETCDCTEECTTSSSTSSTTTTSTTSTTSTTTTSTTTTSTTTTSTTTTTPTTTTTFTTTTSPTETLTPTCDACDLVACLEALNQGDGVVALEAGCIKIYPIAECGTV